MKLGLGLGLGKSRSVAAVIQWLFNGFATPDSYTSGPLYVEDNLGILRTAGVDKVAIPGARLDGSAFVLTDAGGAPLFSSTTRKTRSQGSVTDYSVDPDWQGMVVMPGATNLLLNSRLLTSGGWATSGSGTSVKNQVGIDGLANTAWTLTDNDAAQLYNRAQPVTVVASTDLYTASAFFKKTSGASSFPGMGLYFGAGSTKGVTINTDTGVLTNRAMNAPAAAKCISVGDYWRVAVSVNNSNQTTVGFALFASVNVDAGDTWDVATQGSCIIDACQCELGLETSFIPTTTTTVTRAATVASFNSTNRLLANDIGGSVRVIPSAAGQTGWVFNAYTDATAEFGLLVNPTTIVLRNRNASVDTDCAISYAHVADRPFEVGWLHTTADGLSLRVREYTSGAWQAWSAWEVVGTAGAKADATIAATFQLGGRNGADQLACFFPVASTV